MGSFKPVRPSWDCPKPPFSGGHFEPTSEPLARLDFLYELEKTHLKGVSEVHHKMFRSLCIHEDKR